MASFAIGRRQLATDKEQAALVTRDANYRRVLTEQPLKKNFTPIRRNEFREAATHLE